MSENQKEEAASRQKEWWRQDSVDAVGWAVVFIWGALILIVETTGYATDFSWWDGWAVFFTGAGVVVLVETLIRLLLPQYRKSWLGGMIFGLCLLSIGIGDWTGWRWIWAAVLIAIAAAILHGVIVRRN
jgi:prepilin signal peptidase PulO-like enzyme (type II secretory pathway)